MSFVMSIDSVSYLPGEAKVHGKIIDGAFSGADVVTVTIEDGSKVQAKFKSYIMHNFVRMPVTAQSDTTLTFCLVWPDAAAKIALDQILTGINVKEKSEVSQNDEDGAEGQKIDVSHLLADANFWGLILNAHLTNEDDEEPKFECFGCDEDSVSEYYAKNLEPHFANGDIPYLRAKFGHRIIDLELHDEGSIQMFFIQRVDADHRIMTGYHSGHFSLPAFRVEEVQWLEKQEDTASPFPLLILSACYFDDVGEQNIDLATRLLSRVPGVKAESARQLAEIFLDNYHLADVTWEHEENLGWTNNWDYSQRNPDSRLSKLNQRDYKEIKAFFR